MKTHKNCAAEIPKHTCAHSRSLGDSSHCTNYECQNKRQCDVVEVLFMGDTAVEEASVSDESILYKQQIASEP